MSGLLQIVERRDRTVEESPAALDTITRLASEQSARVERATSGAMLP